MVHHIPRIYLDTSVFGGCFDDEFSKESLLLFKLIRADKFTVILSETVVAEINKAPANIQSVLISLPTSCVEYTAFSAEVINLRDEYISKKVLGIKHKSDAEHVASTVSLILCGKPGDLF